MLNPALFAPRLNCNTNYYEASPPVIRTQAPNMTTVRRYLPITGFLLLLGGISSPVVAQDTYRLSEVFAPGHQYRVISTLTIQGRIAIPAQDKTKSSQIIDMTGRSSLTYDERILPPLESGALRTVRAYRDSDFSRLQGTLAANFSFRPSVRRMVFLRGPGYKLRFSPDAPLTWDEIDLLRTDIFSPVTVAGLLPIVPVRPGQSWRISPEAITELTDIEKVEAGELTVKFLAVALVNDRRTARLAISGNVRGVNEDGPNRQSLDGSTAYFDLDAGILSYLSIKGAKEMLDGRGEVVGRTEGQFTMSRSVGALPSDLTDAALGTLDLKPTAENTLLLYDNPNIGVRFLHPRTWRVGAVQGRQVTLEQTRGSGGILITVETAAKVPTSQEYQKEIDEFLKQVKARDVRLSETTVRIRNDPPLERFAIDAEMGGEACRLLYAVLKQSEGGATVAIRLPSAQLPQLIPEAERILRSVSVTRTIEAK